MAQRRLVPTTAAAVGLVLIGCTTPNRPFRSSTVPVTTTSANLRDPAARAATAATSLERHDGFTIGIVEFDDQGRYWDRRQVDALEAEIVRNAGGPDDPGVLLPVFVHGWRHNAGVCDANLACFRELARRIGEDQRAAIALTGIVARPRPVVAVFVG